MRIRLAHICFALSSLFKALGKFVITKERTILVDALSLPGWFILDECMIHQIMGIDKRLIGFEWHVYPMPGEWCKTMQDLKARVNI